MCGRYTYYSAKEVVQEFNLIPKASPQLQLLLDTPDNFNVAPGMQMPVIVRGEQEHQPELMTWGLIPSWSKDKNIGYKLINAREETLFEKPMWKRLLRSHRCVVPAMGFYEWKKTDDGKQPYYITPKKGKIFSFAGLWDEWTDPAGKKMKSYTIITTSPNEEMSNLHDRMPVILSKQQADIWLSPTDISQDLADDILKPAPDGSLKLVKVSTDVNSSQNNSENLIYPLED